MNLKQLVLTQSLARSKAFRRHALVQVYMVRNEESVSKCCSRSPWLITRVGVPDGRV